MTDYRRGAPRPGRAPNHWHSESGWHRHSEPESAAVLLVLVVAAESAQFLPLPVQWTATGILPRSACIYDAAIGDRHLLDFTNAAGKSDEDGAASGPGFHADVVAEGPKLKQYSEQVPDFKQSSDPSLPVVILSHSQPHWHWHWHLKQTTASDIATTTGRWSCGPGESDK